MVRIRPEPTGEQGVYLHLHPERHPQRCMMPIYTRRMNYAVWPLSTVSQRHGGDKEAVAQARQRLQAALSAPKVVKKQKDFEFVIDNRNTYTLLNDFKSPEARNKMAAWQKNRIQLDKKSTATAKPARPVCHRQRCATSNAEPTNPFSLKHNVRRPKPHCMRKPKTIRNLEIQSRKK